MKDYRLGRFLTSKLLIQFIKMIRFFSELSSFFIRKNRAVINNTPYKLNHFSFWSTPGSKVFFFDRIIMRSNLERGVDCYFSRLARNTGHYFILHEREQFVGGSFINTKFARSALLPS